MSAMFGILFLIGAAFWLIVTVRALPGSTIQVAGGTLRNTWVHTVIGIVLPIGFLISGVSLLCPNC